MKHDSRYQPPRTTISLDILTSTHLPFAEFNAERYNNPRVEQAPEILAHVGALMKSKRADNPLAGLAVRRMVLAGTSASAGVLINYLPAHMVLRLPDMKPIYDGFLVTSSASTSSPGWRTSIRVTRLPTTPIRASSPSAGSRWQRTCRSR